MSYHLEGRVIRGEGWARSTGYPTANLDRRSFRSRPIPSGVYVGWARVGRRQFGCLVVIGVPFVRQRRRGTKVEIHLLGFRGNLRGRRVTADTIRKLRPIRSYANHRTLAAQIERDIQRATRILRSHGLPR